MINEAEQRFNPELYPRASQLLSKPTPEEIQALRSACFSHGSSCNGLSTRASCITTRYGDTSNQTPWTIENENSWVIVDCISRAFKRIIDRDLSDIANHLYNSSLCASFPCDYSIFAYAAEQGRISILATGLRQPSTIEQALSRFDHGTVSELESTLTGIVDSAPQEMRGVTQGIVRASPLQEVAETYRNCSFTKEQRMAGSFSIRSINSQLLFSLTPDNVFCLANNQVKYLPIKYIPHLAPHQIQYLNPDQIPHLAPYQVQHLPITSNPHNPHEAKEQKG